MSPMHGLATRWRQHCPAVQFTPSNGQSLSPQSVARAYFAIYWGVSPSTVQGSLRVPAGGGGGHNRGAVKLVKPIFTHSLPQTGSPRALARRSPQGRFLARTETPCQRSHNGFASSGRPPSYALGSTHVGLPTCRFLGNDSVKPFFFVLFSSEREQEDARSQARTPETAAPGTWGR